MRICTTDAVCVCLCVWVCGFLMSWQYVLCLSMYSRVYSGLRLHIIYQHLINQWMIVNYSHVTLIWKKRRKTQTEHLIWMKTVCLCYTECKKKRTICLGADWGGIYWRKLKSKITPLNSFNSVWRSEKIFKKHCAVFKLQPVQTSTANPKITEFNIFCGYHERESRPGNCCALAQ